MDINPDNMIFIHIESIGPMLHEREARDTLRSEIDPDLEAINRRLSEGYRITRIERTVNVDEQGLTLMFFMEKDQ